MGSAGRRVRERGWSVIGGAGHIQEYGVTVSPYRGIWFGYSSLGRLP